MRILVVAIAVGLLSQAVGAQSWMAAPANRGGNAPINVIFDTDMWTDIDDVMALAMLHTLHDRRELNLLAVTISTDDPWCVSYVDLVNTFYGHAQIPIGIAPDGIGVKAFRKVFPATVWPTIPRYIQVISERKKEDGSLMYPRRLVDGVGAAEAVTLLRKTLAAQPDGSVVIIQVGYSTNLARLLDSGPDGTSALSGPELIRKKVRLLSVMGGNFGETMSNGERRPKGVPEFNVRLDVPAAQKVFSQWPTPLVASGFEIGVALWYPGSTLQHDYRYHPHHPLAETYRYYCEEQRYPKCPHEHATFDLTSVLYAARPDRDYFLLSKPGRIVVLDDGGTRFEEVEGGLHQYLILSEAQKARTLEALVMLTSQPPARHLGH